MSTVADVAPRHGLDLGALWHELWQPWRELHLWPPFSWLTPQPHVCLLQADGEASRWAGDAPMAGDARTAPFTAVELPEALRLECRLQLPAMAAADLHDAVALEVRTASPFDPSDLAWGYRARPAADGAVAAHAVLASRRAVEQHLAGCAERLAGRMPPEVWARDDEGRAVVLQGYGESARERRAVRGRRLAYALGLLALVLAAAAAVTPTVQLKLRAMQAAIATQDVGNRLAPLLAQREALVRTQGDLEALRGLMAEHVEPLAVVDLLTRLIPDDTFVQRLQVQGSKVTISGQTPNTAALMNALSGHPDVRDVRSPSAATRASGGRENFTIELSLSPPSLQPPVAGAASGAKS
ncbi:MAG: PilN domain-containing protein [Burkholderiaceae bacterium]|nr:PilN domain-containing protein [Burkholderiaceae bacterium]